ncbi:hypothetical protein EJ05DRAFT_490851 [Pseudovirgaria hyperparasitica]|uniref:Uncharacterized protein n=1 Tax=Pseudovirgaria hyperparasitica TaxID=470096 RepID=A0A6A6VTD1_9PEZI|nr:uncharacterized protein EJ05DRAFT_490851 [Pseudovirgaria hyperparasitica]KAF2752497.1 hypothetical protein EJ05DRAFT_490851 [Pseudovirgaria hyperparasitica]
MPPSRQPTSRSDAGRSLRERLTQPLQSIASKQRAPSPQRYPWKIGIYNGVTWPKLKAHLETLFPGTEFKERTVIERALVKERLWWLTVNPTEGRLLDSQSSSTIHNRSQKRDTTAER